MNLYIIGIVSLVIIIVVLAEIELFSMKSKIDIVLPKTNRSKPIEVKPKDSGLQHPIYVYDASQISTKDLKELINNRQLSDYEKSPVTEHIAETINTTTKKLWQKITRENIKTPINSVYNIVKEGTEAFTNITPLQSPSSNNKIRILHHKDDKLEGFLSDGKVMIYKK